MHISMITLYSRCRSIVFWMFVVLGCFSLEMFGEETSTQGQVVLLKNRQVLRGEIALYGERYLITQPHSEIRLQRDQVEHICHDLQEAYRYLQHQIRFGEASDHLQLAQWCLDENLFREARSQLEEGMFKRPDHPRIDLIRRQLELAKARGTTDTTRKTPNALQSDSEELDALFDQMPSQVVETFTRVIQPILLNSCSARGCHGLGGNNQFLLHRSTRGQQPSQRVTLRNLQSVLRWVDQENLHKSPLLHFAETPHFTAPQRDDKRGTWSPDSLTARRLSAWVRHFSKQEIEGRPPSPVAISILGDQERNSDTVGSEKLFNWSEVHKRADRDTGPRFGKPYTAAAFRPRDPFDAAIFNRRNHPDRPTKSEGDGVSR